MPENQEKQKDCTDQPDQPDQELSNAMLREARSRLVNICLLALVGVGLLVMPMYIMRIQKMGWNFGAYVHMVIVPLGILVAIFMRRLSLNIRSVALLGIALASAFSGLLTYGIAGSGFFGMGMLACIIAAIALGRPLGILVLVIATAVFVSVMLGVFSGNFDLFADVPAYIQTKTAWIMALSGFVLPVLMLVVGIEEMHRLLRGFIGDKVKNSREIEEKNAFLESLYNATASMFIVTDDALRIQECNEAFFKRSGYTLDFMQGQNVLELLFEEADRQATRARFAEKNKDNTENRESVENKWRTAAGDTILVNWNNNPVYTTSGTLRYWLISGIDISEQRLLEKELQHSQKMQSIGQLAGGVAHDFNNMLAAIIGSADLLRAHTINEKGQHYLKTIIETGHMAAGLTRKLLGFSRFEQGPRQLLDLNTVIKDTVHLLNHGVSDSIEVQMKLTDEVIIMRGEVSSLVNALLNLGINARDAMPEGGVLTFASSLKRTDDEFSARMLPELPPGHYAEIAVMDTGSGIAPEFQEKIFEPFYTTKEKGKGTGLGLASVFATVKRHGGGMYLYSEVDKGSVFRIYLPCEKKALDHEKVTSSITRSPRPFSILLVEDDEAVRETTRRLLENFQHFVSLAQNGREALDILIQNEETFDLVILDWLMPEMGGKETLRRIRHLHPNLPVIIVSGFAPDLEGLCEEIQEKDEKANEKLRFLSKPYQKEELLSLISVLGS